MQLDIELHCQSPPDFVGILSELKKQYTDWPIRPPISPLAFAPEPAFDEKLLPTPLGRHALNDQLRMAHGFAGWTLPGRAQSPQVTRQ